MSAEDAAIKRDLEKLRRDGSVVARFGSAEDAEDAVQETLLRAWTRVGTYAGTSTFRAWLYAVATNACLDALRRRKRRPWPTDVVEAAEAGTAPGAPTDIPWHQTNPDS